MVQYDLPIALTFDANYEFRRSIWMLNKEKQSDHALQRNPEFHCHRADIGSLHSLYPRNL